MTGNYDEKIKKAIEMIGPNVKTLFYVCNDADENDFKASLKRLGIKGKRIKSKINPPIADIYLGPRSWGI